MARLVLILGGVRSGKSRFAGQLAVQIAGNDVLFVATAQAGDAEMRRRIDDHRRARPQSWETREQPRGVGEWLLHSAAPHEVVVVDCLTLLVSNALLEGADPLDAEAAENRVRAEALSLIKACESRTGTVIVVSGEVGQGVVPDHLLGRLFRDLLGGANQLLGRHAAAVYLMVAGFPIEAKSLASTLDQAVAASRDGTHKRISMTAKKAREQLT